MLNQHFKSLAKIDHLQLEEEDQFKVQVQRNGSQWNDQTLLGFLIIQNRRLKDQ